MQLKFYTQTTRKIEDFKPIETGKVRLYTCGPTVYNYLTVGNWTAYVYWDILVRLLTASDYEVKRVMNITDVGHLVSDADEGEDKLEKGAKREGTTAWEVAKMYTEDFLKGMDLLNLVQPFELPRATEYITQQLQLVEILKSKGFTYEISDGIYYDTSKFPRYGDFAELDLAAQKAGARVTRNTEKRNDSDFALWKFSPTGEARDMEWETPASLLDDNRNGQMGFPGWHLECSAMAASLLGETIDIHTGGIDHIPVHHTNEIAQSEAAFGVPFAHYWLHNNHLKVDGTKISKSLGNGYTLGDLSERGFEPLDLRMFILQSHYRTEGNFTFDNLTAAKSRRAHWRSVAALRHQIHPTLHDSTHVESQSKTEWLYAASTAIHEALAHDIDTPAALALVDDAFAKIESHALGQLHQHAFTSFLEDIDALLGLALLETSPDISDELKRVLVGRTQAKEAKDYARSDQLRDELKKEGIGVRDTPSGQIWFYL